MEEGKPDKPQISKELVREKLKKVVGSRFGGGKGQVHDRLALILEWVRTDPTKHPHILPWLESKGIHKMTLPGWGGAATWHRLRDEVRAEAYARAIEKTPDIISRGIEDLFEVRSEATRLARRLIERAHRDLDAEEKLTGNKEQDEARARERDAEKAKSSFNTGLLERISESLDRLAETDAKLKGVMPQAQGGTTINMYGSLLDAIRQRDAKHGVIDTDAKPSDG